MKKGLRNIMVAASMCVAMSAVAQSTETGYFLEDYTYRYQLNPALGNSKNFVAMPALGNLNIGINGTLGLKDVLYNVNGKTTTFMNPNISAEEVMSNIGDMNRIGMDMRINILGFGFKAFNGYNTVTLGVRSSFGVKIPGSAFSLLKEGISNKKYEIANIKGYGNAYVELALNHSRQITSEWTVGGTFKFLVGAANANINLRKADLTLGTEDWFIETDGDLNVNMKGFKYKTELNDYGREYVNDVDVDGAGPGGFGIAVDLGAVYKPAFLPDWEFSAALLDLGFIGWSNNVLASTNGVKSFQTSKYTFNVDDDAPNSFDNEWDIIKDDLSTLYELQNMGDQGSQTRALGATFNIGAQYTLPMYNRVHFGLLNTTHVQSEFSWTEFRLSANYMPCKVFDLAANVSAGTFGVGIGWLLNLHAPGFNLFLGMDRLPSKLAKQGVPLNSNAAFNLGINFPF